MSVAPIPRLLRTALAAIATITSKWGETYKGWTQPWFRVNH